MRYLFLMIITLIFFASSTAMSEEWFGSVNVIYISLIILLVMLIFFKKIEIRYNPKLTLAMFGFTLFCTIAALINSDANLLFSALGYFVLFLAATLVIPSYFKEDSGKVVFWTVLVSQIPIILWPIITNGIDTEPYRGIFDNPNSLGGVVTTVFVVVLSIVMQRLESLLFAKEKQSNLKIILWFTSLSLLFLLVIMTGSRTGFVASVLAIIVSGLFLMMYTIKHSLVGNLIVKTTFLLPIFGLVLWVTNKLIPITAHAEEVIFGKFTRKADSTLDGRDWVWEKTISESGLFGNGSDYFSLDVGLGAHNTFISILGQYGWLAVSTFVIFLLIGLYHCFNYALSDNKNKYLPLLMLVTFLALSMGEVMVYKSSMIAAFILIGLVSNNKKIVIIGK